jgi:hypothetical protein
MDERDFADMEIFDLHGNIEEEEPSPASSGYSPWVPPFHFDTVAIFDSKGHRVCDMRGWGFLTGGGSLNLPEDEAAKIQDAMGEKIAALMNKDAGL